MRGLRGAESWLQILSQVLITLFTNCFLATTTTTKEKKVVTQTQLKELFTYNATTGIFTRRVVRGKQLVGYQLTRRDKDGYIHTTIDKRTYFVHRLVWLYVHGYFPPNCIDHKNRQRDDNRLCNLRAITTQENQFNRKAKGYRLKPNGRYEVRIKIMSKYKYIATVDTEEEAITLYIETKKKYHKIKEYNEQE